MAITQGQLTYDAEGMEGGPFHSRKLHVPSGSSGLTIGRGYDMKEKSSAKIAGDLSKADVAENAAILLSQAAGLFGDAAKQFIAEHDLAEFEISMHSQEVLFHATYEEMVKDVRRICDKPDCVAAYGAVDWDELDIKIKDVMVDLRYRGDYTPRSRKRIQSLVANNDVGVFTEALLDRDFWLQVPQDRFNRRAAFLQE
ncbi:MAG: hypothetical protein ACI8WB_000062 [Phenylobacterium sp.]|jgi:hypothetical protein